MAYADAAFAYHLQSSEPALDTKRSAFVGNDDSAVLDPSMLETDHLQSPHIMAFRKDSFANSNGVLSPADSHTWDPRYASALSVEPASAGAPGAYHEDVNFYGQQSHQHIPAYTHRHQPSWTLDHGPETCPPAPSAEFMQRPPQHFDAQQYATHQSDNNHAGFSQPPPPLQYTARHHEADFNPALQVQTPMSPHSHQDWMGMAQQEVEGRPSHKRMRPGGSPRTLVEFRTSEGIRKRNGRIEIPQERNITTIEELIGKTTDEDSLKELKQQKRLLRNREAALASRQRKKKHTEDLEVKEKSYTTQISMLENQLAELSIDHEQEQQIWMQRLEERQRVIDLLEDRNRELIMQHNEETSSLRRRNHILMDQLEAGPAPAMSAAPSSTGFTDVFSAEMEALTMGPHDWDGFLLANDLNDGSPHDFSFDPRPEPIRPSPAVEAKVPIAPAKDHNDNTIDQPIASGLLFMLLLCGAFVASQPASSQPADLPKMPADVRAAAPAVLNNLLSESNTRGNNDFRAVAGTFEAPMPSGHAFSKPTAGRIDRLHRTLTSPTRQQEIDQAFSLTTAQYAAIANTDVPIYNPQPSQSETSQPPRRNLVEALANIEREHTSHTKAEVYTRSLLWDQIPTDVVNQFKEMVRDHNEIEAREQRQQPTEQRLEVQARTLK